MFALVARFENVVLDFFAVGRFVGHRRAPWEGGILARLARRTNCLEPGPNYDIPRALSLSLEESASRL